jgi:predicted alpha/beta hydrolase family esterase
MTNYFIIPGLGGSGPEHWQTYFEKSGDNFRRIDQKDWDAPDMNEWTETIEKVLSGYDPESVVLVGHSLGCLTIASWASRYNKKVKAALLVAPPDTELLHKKFNITLFDRIATQKINFQTILVGSTNDQWASIERVEYYASKWGSKFINIGAAGHINDLSGFGEWKEGLEILYSLS